MKLTTACIVVGLLAVVAVASADAMSLADRIFSQETGVPRCGKQGKGKPCLSKSKPCCSRMGFCGNRAYHCKRRYGCQSGCKNAQSLVDPGKPKKVVASQGLTKTIVKTISSAVPVCKNCKKKATNKAMKQLVKKAMKEVKHQAAQKKEEETTETVTEQRPAEKEKKPTCGTPNCHTGSVTEKLDAARKTAAKLVAEAKQKAGVPTDPATGKPKMMVVKVSSKSLNKPHGPTTIIHSLPLKLGGDKISTDVLNPSGY